MYSRLHRTPVGAELGSFVISDEADTAAAAASADDFDCRPPASAAHAVTRAMLRAWRRCDGVIAPSFNTLLAEVMRRHGANCDPLAVVRDLGDPNASCPSEFRRYADEDEGEDEETSDATGGRSLASTRNGDLLPDYDAGWHDYSRLPKLQAERMSLAGADAYLSLQRDTLQSYVRAVGGAATGPIEGLPSTPEFIRPPWWQRSVRCGPLHTSVLVAVRLSRRQWLKLEQHARCTPHVPLRDGDLDDDDDGGSSAEQGDDALFSPFFFAVVDQEDMLANARRAVAAMTAAESGSADAASAARLMTTTLRLKPSFGPRWGDNGSIRVVLPPCGDEVASVTLPPGMRMGATRTAAASASGARVRGGMTGVFVSRVSPLESSYALELYWDPRDMPRSRNWLEHHQRIIKPYLVAAFPQRVLRRGAYFCEGDGSDCVLAGLLLQPRDATATAAPTAAPAEAVQWRRVALRRVGSSSREALAAASLLRVRESALPLAQCVVLTLGFVELPEQLPAHSASAAAAAPPQLATVVVEPPVAAVIAAGAVFATAMAAGAPLALSQPSVRLSRLHVSERASGCLSDALFNALPPAAQLRCIRAVATALSHIHRGAIAHRNVCPDSIFFFLSPESAGEDESGRTRCDDPLAEDPDFLLWGDDDDVGRLRRRLLRVAHPSTTWKLGDFSLSHCDVVADVAGTLQTQFPPVGEHRWLERRGCYPGSSQELRTCDIFALGSMLRAAIASTGTGGEWPVPFLSGLAARCQQPARTARPSAEEVLRQLETLRTADTWRIELVEVE